MFRTLRGLLVVVLLLFGLAVPAGAIVHKTTPITCTPAVVASGGAAGGFAARFVLMANSSNGPPMPAQGLAHSAHGCAVPGP